MPDLLVAALGFSLSQVLLGLLLLLRQPDWGLRERLYGLFMLAILGYLCMPLAEGTGFAIVAGTVQTAAPGLFWLFSASVFDDHFRLRPWQLGLVGFTVVMPLIGWVLGVVPWLFVTLPQGVEFALLGLTLWVVSRHWRTDLVEARRRLRLWFVGLNGTYLFLLILSREILFPGAQWLATWEYLPPAVLLLVMNLALLQYRSSFLFQQAPEQPRAPQAVTEFADPGAVARLMGYMEEGSAWREMGLTIGELAKRLEIPQYRLRQLINQGLGYRNFSDFLNSYRVREAARRLADPGEVQLPVLTIAMDAGFRSLSSFNKAFKDAHEVTPTAWRKQHTGARNAAA